VVIKVRMGNQTIIKATAVLASNEYRISISNIWVNRFLIGRTGQRYILSWEYTLYKKIDRREPGFELRYQWGCRLG